MKITVTLLVFFLLLTCSSPVFSEDTQVRVLIRRDVSQVKLGIWGPYEVYSRKTGKRLGMGNRLKTQPVRAGEGGILFGESFWATPHLRLVSLDSNKPIQVNGRKFRGELELVSKGEGKLWVINRVGIEEYLPGVLGWEVGALWPMEALKAQAIVSRTMVAHRMWISRDKEYDVTSDVSTQVYGGKSSEKWLSARACAETAGEVLAYGGELLSATFHANCGGHTEDAAELWAIKGDRTPLKGVPDPFCRNLKHYRWQTDLNVKEFMDLMGPEAAEVGNLAMAEVIERNRSNRVRAIRLLGNQGAMTLTGRRFRELLGADCLRSLNFNMNISARKITFEGFGWGHGVGLCQWGAYGMARQGKKREEILEFYFPQSQRRALKGLPGFS